MANTFTQILDNPALPRAFLVEIQPWDNSAGAIVKIGLGDSNAPASPLHYEGFFWSPKIKRIFSSQLAPLSANLTLASGSAPQVGQVELTIGDSAAVPDSTGVARDLRDLEYDGQQIRILLGDPTGVFADFGEIFNGTIEDVQWTDQVFSIAIANRANVLDTPVQENSFTGDGTEAGGNANVKGKLKPLLYGVKRNFQPPLLDEGKQIYQIHDGSINSVLGVFDRGIELTNAGDIVGLSLPSLSNWTPEGGKYVTDLGNGRIRLGATPDGPVTVDAEGDNTGGYITRLGDLINRILTTKGPLVAADVDATTLATFNLDRPGVSGIWLPNGGTILSLLQGWVDPVGAIWFFDRNGTFQLKVLKFGSSVATIGDADLAGSPTRVQTAPPVWEVRTGYEVLGIAQDLGTIDLPKQAASSATNLLGANANSTQTGAFVYYNKKLLSDFDGGTPESLSFGVWFKDPTANVTNMRVQLLFFDGADAQVGSTAEGNFVNTAAVLTRSVVEAVSLPVGAVKLTAQTTGATNFADVENSFAMLNRGPVALPFVPAQGALGGADATTADKVTFVSGGQTVEALKPAEAGAEATVGKGIDVLVDAGGFERARAIALNAAIRGRSIDSRNLLFNAGFEDGGNFWARSGGVASQVTFLTVSTVAFSGNGSLQIEIDPATEGTLFVNNAEDDNVSIRYIEVNPGDVVILSGQAFRPGGDGIPKIQLVAVDKDKGGGAQVLTLAQSGSASWEFLTGSWTVTSGKKFVYMRCFLTLPTVASSARFDELSLQVFPAGAAAPSGTKINATLAETVEADSAKAGLALTVGGSLQSIVRQDQGNGILRSILIGRETLNVRDGITATFAAAYQNVPKIGFAGGLSQDPTLTGKQYQSFVADSLNTSSFVPLLRIKSDSGTLSTITETTAVTPGAGEPPNQIKRASASTSFDSQYIFFFTGHSNGAQEPGDITFDLWTKHGAGAFVKRLTTTLLFPGTGGTQQSATITDSALVQNDIFGLSIASQNGATFDTFDKVTFQHSTGAGDATATPANTPDVIATVFAQ